MIIGIILAVGMLSTVAAVVIPKIIATRAEAAQWSPLLTVAGAMVRATDPAEVKRVDLALARALDSLQEFGPWKQGKQEALAKLRVIVNPVESWKDSTGQWVAGQTYFTTVTVGVSLAALCHEVAHVLEIALDGASDDTHRTWVARGITAATDDYARKMGTK
jgi:hypothetical protein